MEISAELRDSVIKKYLSLCMDVREAEQFADLDYAVSLISKGQPCWQALVSIGTYAAILAREPRTPAEEAGLQAFIDCALEPLEALFESLVPKPGEESPEGERARLLFHTRFALGFILVLASSLKTPSRTVSIPRASELLSVQLQREIAHLIVPIENIRLLIPKLQPNSRYHLKREGREYHEELLAWLYQEKKETEAALAYQLKWEELTVEQGGMKVIEPASRAKTLLQELAATKTGIRGYPGTGVYLSSGMLFPTEDMKAGKYLTALLMWEIYEAAEQYGEALYLITEAYACQWSSVAKGTLLKPVPALLDHWAAKLEELDASEGYIVLDWLELFAETAEILSLCQETDSSGALPNECKRESAQFLAWKFGQIVGRFFFHLTRLGNPYKELVHLLCTRWGLDPDVFARGVDKVYGTLSDLLLLISEFVDVQDWGEKRKGYISEWKERPSSAGCPLSEIGPESDLFWAMRIGFADKALELTGGEQALVTLEVVPLPVVRDVEIIKNIVETIALRQLKQQQDSDKKHDELLRRLPPGKKEVYQRLEQLLGSLWSELPVRVLNVLAKAEAYYQTKVNDDDAKVWFVKAVEASLCYYLTEPLTEYMQHRGWKAITVCFPSPQRQEQKSPDALRKLGLSEWAGILEVATDPSYKGFTVLATKELREFMKYHYGGPRLPDLRQLTQSLRKAQEYRSGSAHYQDAISRYDKETWELEELRKLVFGIERPSSLIGQIVQLLAGRRQIEPPSDSQTSGP